MRHRWKKHGSVHVCTSLHKGYPVEMKEFHGLILLPAGISPGYASLAASNSLENLKLYKVRKKRFMD